MPDQVFTAGQILTANQVTDLQNNAPSFIGQYAMSGGVITVDNAFTSTFTNYLIIGSGLVASGSVDLYAQFRYAGPTTQSTAHYQGLSGVNYLGAAATALGGNNAAAFNLGNITSSGPQKAFNMTVFQTNAFPGMSVQTWDSTNAAFYSGAGYVNQSRTYTGMIFTTSSGTITAGTIRVYGLRQS